jgi:shikimate 5-dehydrogenase
LLKHAREKKLKRIEGLSMFINQAAAQFKLFTGKNPDPKLMRKTAVEKLSAR